MAKKKTKNAKTSKAKSKSKSSVGSVKKTKPRGTRRAIKNSKRVTKLPSKINAKPRNKKQDLRRPKNSSGKANRKNANNLKKTSKKSTIKRRAHKVWSITFNKFLRVIEFNIKLRKKDELDLFDLENQDAGIVYLVLLPYFLKLVKKVRKKSQYFRLAINYFDGEVMDTVSSPLADYDKIPEAIERDLLNLIERLINDAQKYRKNHAIFKLMSVELWRYDEIK